MTYDAFLRRGLGNVELWNTIKHKCVSHHDMLTEMRSRQEALAAYAKLRVSGTTTNGVDAVQQALLGDIKFLETMAWRLYMFGSRSLFSPKPGKDGELLKRKRTDPTYWKMRGLCGAAKADKWLKATMRQEWERTILRRYAY